MCSLYRNEYRNIKLAKATMGRGLERVKRTGRDEPVEIIIYIYAWKQHKESPCVAIFITN
jgi:hypothetical protein